jgi:hypothetical protein
MQPPQVVQSNKVYLSQEALLVSFNLVSRLINAIRFRHRKTHLMDTEAQKVELLYREALQLASDTPQIGSTLVGNCTTVHFGMLDRARKLFGSQVQFAIGHVSIRGKDHFKFSLDDFETWRAGATKPTYPLHAWLELHHHNYGLIDLTLLATLRHLDSESFLGSETYLTAVTAKAQGIQHHVFKTGDDLLLQLNMVRGIRGA